MPGTPIEHPDKDKLVAFGLGKLDSDQAEKIADHLDSCHDCSETIISMQDDTFVSLVRNAPAPENNPDQEPQVGNVPESAVDVTVDSSCGATDSPELPTELRDHPRYEILELIGRGGMGDVYKAQHKVMNRVVALKVIKPELVRNEAAVARFQREVQAAARLHHGKIVTAHDAEQAGDLHYLVMEYVDGINLDEVIRDRGALPVAEACNYVQQAAEGLGHAHEHGMVHRDIKPHNLMLSPNGQLRILDFGLAGIATQSALIDADSPDAGAKATTPRHLTTMGSVMGTPDYIAPEQARDAHSADIRADIYSLGCTLYCLLTGEPPHKSDSVVEKLKAHAEHEPEAIESVRVDVPEEVADVVRRMMAKDPAERFQTPAEVADALAPFVDENRTGGGGSGTALSQAGLSSPSNPLPITFALCFAGTLSILASVLAVVLFLAAEWITGIPFALLAWLKFGGLASLPVGATALFLADRSERKNSHASAVKAGLLNLLPANPFVVLLLPLTIWTLIRLSKPAAREMYETCPALDREEVKRRWPLVITTTACLLIAIFGGMVIYVQTDYGTVRIIVEDRDAHVALRCDDGHRLIELEDHDLTIGVRSGENTLRIGHGDLEFETDEFTVKRGEKVVVRVSRVEDNLEIRAGDVVIGREELQSDASIASTDAEDLKLRRFVGNHLKPITAVDVSRHGRLILSTSYDRSVRVWDSESGKEVCSFLKHGKSAETAAFSPNSQFVASTGGDGSVWLWDARTGASIREFQGHTGMVRALAFSRDGNLLVTGSADYGPGYGTPDRDNTLRLWDVETGTEIRRLEGVTQAINAAAFAPDGKTVAAGGEYKMVGLWDVKSGKQISKFPSPNSHPISMAFSPDGRTIATGHAALVQLKGKQSFFDPENSVVCLWDVASRRLRRKLRGHTAPVNAVSFSSDGRLVVSACGGHHHDYSWYPAQNNSLRVWDRDSGEQLFVRDFSFSIESLALFPDDKSIIIGGGDLAIGSGDDQPEIVLWSPPERVWPDVQTDNDLIQGKWKRVALTDNGEELSLEDRTERFMTFTGDEFTGPQQKQPKPGKFSLDPTTSPKRIDLHFPSGPNSFIHIRGIYRLEGDRLTIFQATDWTASKRPASFEPKSGDKRTLAVLERVRVSDQELLQGAWTATALELGGQKAPKSEFDGKRMMFVGDLVSRFGKVNQIREFRVNPTTNPKQIDIGGSVAGQFSKAIYELNGDTLKLCLPQTTEHPRPTEFDTEGTRHLSVTLQRAELTDLDKLQGIWRTVALEASGQMAPEPAFKDKYMVIRGERITRVGKLGEVEPFLDFRDFRIDTTASPKSLDISKTDDGEFAEFSQSIYELSGDTLRVCFSQQSDAPRPKSFDTTGTRYFCFTLKRVEPATRQSNSETVGYDELP